MTKMSLALKILKRHNITANFIEEKDGLLFFTTKEAWGIMDWIYDKKSNHIKPNELNGKKEEETRKNTILKLNP